MRIMTGTIAFALLTLGVTPVLCRPYFGGSSKTELRKIYDFRCPDLMINPTYITNDPSNSLILKETRIHCVMMYAVQSALDNASTPERKAHLTSVLRQLQKMMDIFLEGYKFAPVGLQYSDQVVKVQNLRVDSIKTQRIQQ